MWKIYLNSDGFVFLQGEQPKKDKPKNLAIIQKYILSRIPKKKTNKCRDFE